MLRKISVGKTQAGLEIFVILMLILAQAFDLCGVSGGRASAPGAARLIFLQKTNMLQIVENKENNKLGLSWAKLSYQLRFGCTGINIFASY